MRSPIRASDSLELATTAYAGAARGNAYAAMLAAAADPLVRAALERVTRAQLAFLSELYTDLGVPSDQAARHAHLAFALYLGIGDLRLADPDNAPAGPTARRVPRAGRRGHPAPGRASGGARTPRLKARGERPMRAATRMARGLGAVRRTERPASRDRDRPATGRTAHYCPHCARTRPTSPS